jgi:SAM-dependent methyltransferase
MVFNKILRHISLLKLRGDVYYCPICEKGFKTFLPGGPARRPFALCPNCYSLERHRFLWLILEYLWAGGKICNRGKMLHFAPEPCLTKKFKKTFEYLSADFDPEAAPMVIMDITKIKFPNGTFDAIVANHVLEHIPDDREAISELYRVMKKDGWGSFQVPMRGETTYEDDSIITPEAREKAFGQSDHVRLYGSDFYQRLREAGFTTHIYKKHDFFSEEEDIRLSLAIEKELVIVRK